MAELSGFKPVHQSGVNSHTFFCRNVRSIFQIAVLSLLLGFEIEPGQSSQIFLADCLVDSGSSFYSLSVVVSGIGPPISLLFDVS